ncbi:hypothetical protein DB88DRAFT_485389 [Papiliotrema laurentii]|uniref:SHSP domain-containing protein n=1 Tax=Papiliotrema laurentii TaxID=5418 RepID=A0AAD9FTN2_PAPLA|nr:hypothetical protein DB88DRAFT_485389 [Papiliotrema laurentii]
MLPPSNVYRSATHASPASLSPLDPNRRSSESSFSSTSTSQQRVVAQSSTTGCCISAPISPPAHYPGSARHGATRSSPTGSSTENSSSDSTSVSSGSSASSITMASNGRALPPAPRWARPPRYTNRISGRAWSFSQGQERPEIDFDPELFDAAEPDAVQEILKGIEGRIAVKTTPAEYNIMAWLPGFSIDDITISMKGDRTVQIVADLWDEGDHAQWNVLLGEDVNKSAISATFKGSELRVTVKRKPIPAHRSYRSTASSWSAPATVMDSKITGGMSNAPTLATYPRMPLSH